MDPRERFDDLTQVLKVFGQRLKSRIWTALPTQVLADSDGNLVQVQPTVQVRQAISTPNASGGDTTYRNVTIGDPTTGLGKETLVHYPGGGGYTFTHPIKKGDEGLTLFSTLSIDNWWGRGGVQPQNDPGRRHSLSDSILMPGLRNRTRQLSPAPSTTTAQMRSDDGTVLVEIDLPNKQVRIVGPMKVIVDTPTASFTGDIQAKGKITAGFDGSDSVTLQGHTHNQPNDSHGDTEQPTAAPTAGT